MIAELNEIKDLLQINDDSKDTFIINMIPIVQDFIIKYTNNYFEILTDSIYYETNTISFVSGSPSKIVDSRNQFKNIGFVNDIHIRINGSKFNDGIYKINTVNPGEIILSQDDSLINEDEDNELIVNITVVQFPKTLKLIMAKLIAFNINVSNLKRVQSESLGDYSVSYESNSNYPQSLLNDLRPFMQMKTINKANDNLYNIYLKR